MPVEVTKEQACRLKRHLRIARNRAKGHPNELTLEKEIEVAKCISEKKTYSEIQRITGVSRDTVTRLKKKHGFWGA